MKIPVSSRRAMSPRDDSAMLGAAGDGAHSHLALGRRCLPSGTNHVGAGEKKGRFTVIAKSEGGRPSRLRVLYLRGQAAIGPIAWQEDNTVVWQQALTFETAKRMSSSSLRTLGI